jgi:SAM-dependent methyltransferase
MAHPQQVEFCKYVKTIHPEKFIGVDVLDIGSLDINGNNRYLFENYTYTGIDIGEGKNVDIVCGGHTYSSEKQYDVIISTECLEHDAFYKETLGNAFSLLKKGGLLLFTAAGHGRPEHGTSRSDPNSSPYTNEYYRNIRIKDIVEIFDIEELFYPFTITYGGANDIYFYGIKR